ncbi:MAG TPA: hypothetical protein VKU40_09860, partial [Thermoanaerobaculia bacterium]|nr:hypothetical protein [Thermoanaerobaculia bacterium]
RRTLPVALLITLSFVTATLAAPSFAETFAETTAAPAPGDLLTLPAGSVLRPLASPVAPPLATLTAAAEVEVLEVSGRWLRVRWRQTTGWLDPVAEPADEAPAPAASQDDVAVAREVLGSAARDLRAGPFVLITDVGGPLPELLDRLAAEVVEAYAARYGLPLPPDAGDADHGTVVLFAEESDFRAFAEQLGDATGPAPPADLDDLAGQTRGRLAALHATGRNREQVSRLLLHELVHLLNRETLAGDSNAALPPWLDEGLAGDMELFTLTPDGRLGQAEPNHFFLHSHGYARLYGPLVLMPSLVREIEVGRLESVGELVAFDRAAFLEPRAGAARYALAAFWVRYLLVGEGGELAPTFRAWLATRAAGGSADTATLFTRLEAETGRDRERLDTGLRRWMLDLSLLLGLAPERR